MVGLGRGGVVVAVVWVEEGMIGMVGVGRRGRTISPTADWVDTMTRSVDSNLDHVYIPPRVLTSFSLAMALGCRWTSKF